MTVTAPRSTVVPMRALVIAALAGVVVAALALLVGPAPHRLTDASGGDDALAAQVLDVVGDETGGYRGLSVARITGSGVVTTLVGDDGGGPVFEIGSAGKVFTGMVLADLIADGRVRADDTLRTAFPDVKFADPAVGDVTLAELASHRSGLPRLGGGPSELLNGAWTNVTGGDPYGQSVDDLLDEAANTSVGDGRGEVRYSNFGMALLGQALAARTGTPYPQLVTDRILRPLGMSDTTIDADPTGEWAEGATASGRSASAWTGAGYAPAGIGVRSTAADMAKLVAATMNGTAPGADATTPRWDQNDKSRVGYAWFTTAEGLTWHNGATGGFRSYVGYDEAAGEGVVVLGNTNRDVEWIGIRLLGGDAEPSDTALVPWQWAVTIFLVLYLAATLPFLAVGRPGEARWYQAPPDRLRIVQSGLATVAVALLAHRLGDWLTIPPPFWALGVGLAAAGALLLALRWRDLPVRSGGTVWLRRVTFVASVAVSLIVVVAMLALW
ncbi:serine hydrolase domain-containing protein [Cryptosporangium sp. NPDC048952]|uniref:serine hydrolase domain-containing protein n=1 Tax=Cryptosporangium sp. NPDC048952 TaxID=3363961 RepID=UPI00371FBD23